MSIIGEGSNLFLIDLLRTEAIEFDERGSFALSKYHWNPNHLDVKIRRQVEKHLTIRRPSLSEKK